MNKILIVICFLFCLGVSVTVFPEGAVAVLTMLFFSIISIALIRRNAGEDTEFLLRLFVVGLLLRAAFATYIHVYDLRGFFGNDATLYDMYGTRLSQMWMGDTRVDDTFSRRAANLGDSGWGMNYLVAAIYSVVGRSALSAQYFCVVIGAATVPLVYACAYKIFGSRQVGKTSALMVALFPAFIIWSAQLLKDGLIVFLLVLAITMVLQIQENFSFPKAALLLLAMCSILTLRFYIFYMVVAAVAGSFAVGSSSSNQSIFKRLAAVLIVGVGLIYLGAARNAGQNLTEYGDLKRIQQSRLDLSTSAESGFGAELDVSTTEGAITALPVGFAYLMFAPFPWQIKNFRQALAMPEVLLWWAMMPLLVAGLIYTIKYRLRNAIPILLFTSLLIVGYSLFLGNVGTAYRQRTQIQVFLYMFIGVGWTLRKEKREIKKMENEIARQKTRQKSVQTV